MNNTYRPYLVFFLALFFMLPIASYTMAGDLYVCRGANGSLSFTNVPSTGDCKEHVERPRFATSITPTRTRRTSSLDEYIQFVGVRYNVDPHLIKAVIRTESDFDIFAISEKGAQGLMQLMPGTARDLQVRNPFDALQNIDGGTRYLRQMLDTFNGNLKLSLAAYNAGPGAVKRAKGIPSYSETQDYVIKVLEYYRSYQKNG